MGTIAAYGPVTSFEAANFRLNPLGIDDFDHAVDAATRELDVVLLVSGCRLVPH